MFKFVQSWSCQCEQLRLAWQRQASLAARNLYTDNLARPRQRFWVLDYILISTMRSQELEGITYKIRITNKPVQVLSQIKKPENHLLRENKCRKPGRKRQKEKETLCVSCVCVCEWAWEREWKKEKEPESLRQRKSLCHGVCVRMRESEREHERKKEMRPLAAERMKGRERERERKTKNVERKWAQKRARDWQEGRVGACACQKVEFEKHRDCTKTETEKESKRTLACVRDEKEREWVRKCQSKGNVCE